MITIPTFLDADTLRIVTAIFQLAAGRSNATGVATLTPGAASTVVSFDNCSEESQVFLSPKTANAASALANAYISTVGNGSFTIAHANNAQTDRTFGFVCLG